MNLNELMWLNPVLSIFIISLVTNSLIIYINKKTLWSKEAKKIQNKLKETESLRDKIKKAKEKKDTKNIEALTKKSLDLQSKYMSEYMKYSTKPLLFSILIAIIILPWFNSIYGKSVLVIIPEYIPLLGGLKLTWLWIYIIFSLTISFLGKKLFEDKI